MNVVTRHGTARARETRNMASEWREVMGRGGAQVTRAHASGRGVAQQISGRLLILLNYFLHHRGDHPRTATPYYKASLL